ncbi:MAG: group II intron reverse transcriptase/maturase [Dehalococcoidia bacterium]|nr:MAG: group II intron reverse transcriptase/maturase [Dehalococcoidia bacterium]
MKQSGHASVTEHRPGRVRDETGLLPLSMNASTNEEHLMEHIVDHSNIMRAFSRVKHNGGGPGIDGMTVEELPGFLIHHWSAIRELLLRGSYEPQPVKRVEIPKPGGGCRLLGIPTVVDRLIQQAALQVLQPQWDKTFSDFSYGFRPNRSAHDAVAKAQSYLRKGYAWVVDIDLEKFFDRVNHDKLMSLVAMRIADPRVVALIRRYLKSGVLVGEDYHETQEGAPQGGPLSPLLANLLLDKLDKELERRGHSFVRYADDCNIYVRSARSGRRVMIGVTEYLRRKLKLEVNETKSAVDRPWKRVFLGFTFTKRRPNRRKASEKALKLFKEEIRRITSRTRGVALKKIINELASYITGWKLYFGFSEAKSVFQGLDSWVRRRLRCYLWKQWGRAGYRRLVERGVTRNLAWYTAKSAHGPWRISRSPALSFALPKKYFVRIGLPLLHDT